MFSSRFLPIALLAAGLAGCSHEPPKKTEAAAPPVAVETVTAERTSWPSGYEAIGTVRARTSAVLSSRVMGYVREVNAQAGDTVRAGQLLVVLDSRDLEAQYKQADAAVNEARSAVPEVQNGIAGAKANLDLAQVTFNRMKDLFDKRSVSNQELDEAEGGHRLARDGDGEAGAAQLENPAGRGSASLRGRDAQLRRNQGAVCRCGD
jgi:multidrug efflux pump subunit AcrA (membrane-fusion protein)